MLKFFSIQDVRACTFKLSKVFIIVRENLIELKAK